MPIVFCITGGIASGKTFVSDYLQKNGFSVIDADVVAREVVAKGQPVLKRLVNYFGVDILKEDGSLHRRKLKQLVFSDEIKLEKLNQIIHPAIQQKMLSDIKYNESPCVVLIIPLLKSSMIDKYSIKRVLVIDVDRQIQINRVVSRDAIGYELAQSIIDAQLERSSRVKLATDIIVNNGGIEKLIQNVGLMMSMYRKIIDIQ